MGSLIPKIKVGKGTGKKEKHNLSFDCSTTANLGTIQPTMCREMVPDGKFTVKVANLVRLASMPLPTFGRMSLRHYHCFVPYIDLWQPFDAFMSGRHYLGTQSAAFVPTKIPFFIMHDVQQYILDFSDISICNANDIAHPFTITSTNVDWEGNVYNVGTGSDEYPDMEAAIKAAQAADLARVQTAWSALRQGNVSIFGGMYYDGLYRDGVGSLKSDDRGVLNLGSCYAAVRSTDATLSFAYNGTGNVKPYVSGNTPIDPNGADLITQAGDYALLFKFKTPLKRLRTIFIGLGYQFNPYNQEEMSVLKLLAYYKAWFNIFRPVRDLAFVDTACYKLLKKLSEKNGVRVSSGLGDNSLWHNFILSLMNDCFYYLPMDYFSMAVLQPGQQMEDSTYILNSGAKGNAKKTADDGSTDSNEAVTITQFNPNTTGDQSVPVSMQGSGSLHPLTIKLALKMLTWSNKNTIIGRSIREYLKVHYGITEVPSIDDESVIRIGASRTNVQISDVMSTAENEQGYLGEYGGKGIGYGDSEKFTYEAKNFGVWITLTAVVPESGMFQGYLKENRQLNRQQFFDPAFDACGYQVLERGEVMDSYNCDSSLWNPRTEYVRTRAWGFVPRFSHLKVGRNIVNGDLSLAGMYPSMGGYTLDRRISEGMVSYLDYKPHGVSAMGITKPDFVPSIVFDGFRKIDPTDHLGQYNRIFNVTSNDVDHFIINCIFDVVGYLPMKSLSDSFDTIAPEDEGTIKLTHS